MKKIGLFLLMIIGFLSPVFAENGLTFEQFFTTYINTVTQKNSVPQSYQYIQLKYPNVTQKNAIYPLLQKAVYLDLFPNVNVALPLNKQITQGQVINILSGVFDVRVAYEKDSLVTLDWLRTVLTRIQACNTYNPVGSSAFLNDDKIVANPLFLDIYEKLHTSFVSDSGVDNKSLLYGAIKGLVEGANDPYTAFFPPTETHSLTDELQGEYYGIGSHVEMTSPGELVIVAPMRGSPAEKAGLQGGDRIVQIDDKIVDEDVSLADATSLIKGPAGTTVKLKIFRDGKLLDFSIVRAKITVNNVESKIYPKNSQNICVVTISMFDFGVATDFSNVMTDLSTKKCDKYIFDVRNNPGGGLDEVVRMLNYFVPTGKSSVIIKSKFLTQEIVAWQPKDATKITIAPIRVLINEGSASASEIFAGVIKDYCPSAMLVGEKSFGKGSVQELLNYDDGSMLKYTVAKRYMGKSQINIDKKGISPDKIITDKKDTSEDEVLQWAIEN